MTELYWRAIARPRILKLLRSAQGRQQIHGEEVIELVRILIKAKPDQAVEIGSFCGVTSRILAWHLRKYAPGGRLYCIDPFETEKPHEDYYAERFIEKHLGFNYEDMFDRNTGEFGDVVVKIKAFSHEASLPDNIAPKFVFIDGDHSFEGVKRDILRYVPLVSVGGFICFHDVGIGRSGVLKALLETLWPTPNNRYYRLESHVKSLLVLKKIAKPPASGFDAPL